MKEAGIDLMIAAIQMRDQDPIQSNQFITAHLILRRGQRLKVVELPRGNKERTQ